MTDDTVDLSGRLLPFLAYYPFPTLVPNRLGMNATEPLLLQDLRQLGGCASDGPDTVYAPVFPHPELSRDPDVDAPPVVDGGLTASRAIVEVSSAGPDGKPVKVVSWWAAVSGLTFHADDRGRVYVEGPECRVVLFDPADKRWPDGGFRPVVHAEERQGTGSPLGPEWIPCGKQRAYESYAALVVERNAQRRRGTHGRVPDALASIMGMAPMIGQQAPATVITATDRTVPDGFGVRRVGRRLTMRLDEATAKRLHGERGDSRQAVLRYDTTVTATAEDVDQAAMQLLREFDTETLVTIIGLLMIATDTNNRPQQIGGADLARVRGKEPSSAKERKPYAAMSTLLSGVVIEVRSMGDDDTVARLNLFVRQGEIVVRGGHRIPRVTLNDDLFRAMWARGHGVLIDRQLLTIDLNAHEWEARINVALASQWAFGWVRNGYANGKRLRRTAKVLLTEAGIVTYDFAKERRRSGVSGVRQRISNALDGLVRLRLDLKSWKRVKQADDPADDLYEFVPSNALVERLTILRLPALAAPPERPALDGPKPPSKRKRTTSGAKR